MKRALTCVLMALLAQSAAISPAYSANVRVTLQEPRLVDAGSARLVGTARGSDDVRIQRYSVRRERWKTVRTIPTTARGRFRTTVRVVDRPRRFRAVAGGRASVVQVMPAATRPKVPDVPELPEVPDVPEEPTTPTVRSDACGVQPVKADGSYWECTLAEDFTGTELNRAVWKPQTGFKQGTPSGMPCYIDDPSVVSVHDGALHLSVRAVPEPLPCPGLNVEPTAHTAGMVSTYRLFSQQYGRFEARFKNTATTVQGLHEAFWLWPDDRYTNTTLWPLTGEIDIAETYSKHPDLSIPFLHSQYDVYGGMPGVNTAWNCKANRGVFNTYTLEWTDTRLTILVNGRTCLATTTSDSAFQRKYIVALTQGLGAVGNEYDGRAPLPATMTIDYVRVWK